MPHSTASLREGQLDGGDEKGDAESKNQNNNENRPPAQDRDRPNSWTKRKMELVQVPGTKNMKMTSPIVKSKIDRALQFELEKKKVANGSRRDLKGFNQDADKEANSNVPTSLRKIIHREKVQSKDNRRQKPAPLSPTKALNEKKVVVSRGLEMKRVDVKVPSSVTVGHKSSNVVNRTKKHNDAKKESVNSSEKTQTNTKLIRKTAKVDPSSAKTNATNSTTEKKLKHRVVSKSASANVNNNATSSNHQQSLQPPPATTASSAIAAINTGAGEAVPTPVTAVENYRTLQEFLNMPTVKIPQKVNKNLAAPTSTVQDNNSKNTIISNHEHPHYYKSKFWDYVVNNKKDEPLPPEKHKNYDTSQVRQFMEKQRELRKVREIVEQRAREEQLLKKKKQLQELNEKCRTLTQKINVVKKKASKSKSGKKTPPHLDTYGFIRMEMEKIVNKATPSPASPRARPNNKQESPSKSHSKSPSKSSEKARALAKLLSQLPNSQAVSKNTSALLQEFENIVRRECISFFQNKNAPVHPPLTSKGVGTTDSLAELNRTKSSTTSSTSTVISIHNTVKQTNAQDLNHAVSKIQAYWKGYKERKILKEANILPKHLVQMKRQLQFHSSSSGNRREGFVTKAPGEKPYEHFKRRLFLQEENKYVPPSPSSSKQNEEKLTRKSFNEPYPREAIQRIQEAQAEQQQSLSRRNSFSDIIKTTKKNLEFGIIGSPADTPSKSKLTTSNARRKTIGLPAQAPSISAVLYEKLRLLEKETAKSSNVVDGHFPPFERDIDSISSITQGSEDKLDVNESQDLSITDDYFGPSITDMRHTRTSTPINLNQLNKFRSKKQEKDANSPNQRGASEDSTTTVETDLELVVSAGAHQPEESSSNRREEEPTSSDGTGFSFPVPALKLQYEAEQERLRILQKALQATAEYEKTVKSKKPTTPKVKVPTKSEIQDIAKAVAEERIKLNKLEMEKEMLSQKIKDQANNPESSLQLEMMKCQQEAAKATAEMSKWMLEMGRSLLEDRQQQRNIEERNHQQQKQQQNDILKEPVNIAAIVYAAVDEAQRIVETERRNRQQTQVVSTVYHQPCCFTNRPSTITTFKDVSQQVKSATFENSSDASSETTLDKTGTSVPDFQENQDQNELSDRSINVEEDEIKIPQISENLTSPKTYKTETFISEEISQQEEEQDDSLQQEEVEIINSNNLSQADMNIRSSELKEIEEEEPIITENSVSFALDKTETSSIPEVVDAENESILSEIIEQIEDNEKSLIKSISEANKETSEPKKELDVDIISHSPSQIDNIDNDVVPIEEQSKVVDNDLRQLEQPPFISKEILPRESETGEIETTTPSEQSESEASFFLEEEKSESKLPFEDAEKKDIIEPPRTEINEQQIMNDKKELAPETTQIEENIVKEEDNKKIADSLGQGNISSPPNTDKTETSIPEIIGNEEEDDDCGSSLGEDGKLSVNCNQDEDIRMTPKRQEDEQAESIESQLEEEEKLYSSSAVEVGSAKEPITPEAGKDSISETSEKYSESFVSDFEKETESEEHENELLFEKGDDADLLNNTLEDIKENEKIEAKEKVTIESEEDDEDDKLESLHELVQQKELVENEIKHIEIEMLQAQIASSPVDAYLSALEEQLPEATIIKPPPPYSYESKSPEPLLLSAVRTFDVAFESKELKEVIENQVEQVWDSWKLTGHLPEYLPQLNIIPVTSVEDDDDVDVETEEDIKCYEEYLTQVKNLAMVTTVLEGIEKALHIKELEGIGYVDTVRRGPFALEATKYRIPKTKSALCTAVYSLLHRSLPNIKITDDGPQPALPPSTRKNEKWSCRPRDVVENILVQDMIEEEPQWLRLWPEALLVIDQLASKLVHDSLRDVLHNFEIALNTD